MAATSTGPIVEDISKVVCIGIIYYVLHLRVVLLDTVLSMIWDTGPNCDGRLETIVIRTLKNNALLVDAELVLRSYCGQVIDVDRGNRINVKDLILTPWW